MPPQKKYTDYKELPCVTRKSRLPPYNVCTYVPIQCPHCTSTFVEIKIDDLKTTKASKCLQHQRACPDFQGEVKQAPEKKNPTIADLLRQLEESEKRAEARHQEMLRRIGRDTGLPPPDSTSEEELTRRLIDKNGEDCEQARREERKRKERDWEADAARRAQHLDDAVKKRLRAALHPDGKDESQHADLKFFRDLLGL